MIATALREKGQVTLPQEIREAAGLQTGDQLEWSVQQGEIRARKLIARAERKRIYGKLVKQGDRLMLEIPKGYKVPEDAIAKAIREERQSR
jgi:AbrB family looped-hinge helix DNA binding protein